MPNAIISTIERSHADGLHPGAIRVSELPDGTGEIRITFDDFDGVNPAEDPEVGVIPPGVQCTITKRVDDLVAPVPGTRADWIKWIAEVARIGGAPDYAIFEVCDPVAGIEAGTDLWHIVTKPVRWLTPETRKIVNYDPDRTPQRIR